MAKKQEVERLFELVGKDVQAWLAQAKELKMAADALLPHLKEALSMPPALTGVQEKRFAFLHSYMLLTGLALENLIKGVLIGRDPNLVNQDKLISPISSRGGHAITEGAEKIINLETHELHLLRRMEEYLFWAARYPLPLRSGVYLNSENQQLRTFRSNDPDLIDDLFNKLAILLHQEWSARTSKITKPCLPPLAVNYLALLFL